MWLLGHYTWASYPIKHFNVHGFSATILTHKAITKFCHVETVFCLYQQKEELVTGIYLLPEGRLRFLLPHQCCEFTKWLFFVFIKSKVFPRSFWTLCDEMQHGEMWKCGHLKNASRLSFYYGHCYCIQQLHVLGYWDSLCSMYSACIRVAQFHRKITGVVNPNNW